jgi:surfactin synthase thioesterase subunit
LIAYVVPQQEDRFSTNALREYLREKLPNYMLPSVFVTLERIPLNPNGKVDRFALPAPDQTRPDVIDDFVAPRSELEAQIVDSWSQVLGIEKIGIDDDFFDLGGQSFKAIRVARKIGPSVSVMDLFKYPTVRRLATHLSQEQPRNDGLLHRLTPPVPAGENILSLVCIPYGGGNAIVYQPLADALPKNCSLYAVQIPGHDYSRQDDALRPLQEVARQCVEEIQREVPGPVALYGHCVGGALALEIARLLQEKGVEVAGLFMGGAFPSPRLPGKLFEWLTRIFHSDRWRPNRTLYESLRALGGFTDVLDPAEQAFMLQGLRHDAREAEDYYTQAYAVPEGTKLTAPILCLVGQGDRATELYQERFKEWEFFSDSVDLAVVPQAGHYFLKHQADQTARTIVNQQAVWQDSRQRAPKRAAPTRLGLSVFFLIAFGQFISLIGTGLTSFALGVWVYQQTGSVSAFAFISVFALLPGILLLPIAGAIVDRWDRRAIMLLSDVAAACATLLVALLLWADALQIWHIYVVAGIGAIANAFQGPAYMAATAQLVPKQYLGHVNGIIQLGNATGGLLAPLLGGVLVVAIGLYGVVLIDVATFVFAATTLLLVRFPDTLFRKQEEPLLQAVIGGWRYIKKRYGLVAMIAFFTVVNFVFSLVRVLVTPLALSFASPATLGVALAAGGAGMLLGSFAMSLWGGTKRRAEGMVGAVALGGISAIVMGLRPSPIFLALGLFGNEISRVFTNTHWQTLIQTKVGLELQGRVLSTNVMLGLSMQPLGFVLAGPLVSRVFEPLMASDGPLAHSVGQLIGTGPGRGMGLMMVSVGVIAIVWTILGFRYRPLRFMEDDLPDAIPDPVIVADKDVLQAQADRQLMAEGV